MTASSDAPARLALLSSGPRMFVPLDDDLFGAAMADDSYECAEIRFACRVARVGDSVIDGGAHLGCYTLPLAAIVGPTGHVHAFEPLPATAALLQRSIQLNDYGDRVHVHRRALGPMDSAGVLRCGLAPRDAGRARLETDITASPLGASERRWPIEVVALDACDVARPVSLIKLDIEGAELLALRGATRLVREDRPVILCEIDYEQLTRVSAASAQDVFDFLEALHYRPYEIRFDGTRGDSLSHPPTAPVSSVAFIPA